MAGPIGMAVMRSVQKLVCPHCGKVQARGRATGKIACKQCKKLFDAVDGKAKAKPRPAKTKRR